MSLLISFTTMSPVECLSGACQVPVEFHVKGESPCCVHGASMRCPRYIMSFPCARPELLMSIVGKGEIDRCRSCFDSSRFPIIIIDARLLVCSFASRAVSQPVGSAWFQEFRDLRGFRSSEIGVVSGVQKSERLQCLNDETKLRLDVHIPRLTDWFPSL